MTPTLSVVSCIKKPTYIIIILLLRNSTVIALRYCGIATGKIFTRPKNFHFANTFSGRYNEQKLHGKNRFAQIYLLNFFRICRLSVISSQRVAISGGKWFLFSVFFYNFIHFNSIMFNNFIELYDSLRPVPPLFLVKLTSAVHAINRLDRLAKKYFVYYYRNRMSLTHYRYR